MSEDDLLEQERNFIYPVILKPFIRKPEWNIAGLPKAFKCDDRSQLISCYNESKCIDNHLLLQEWIPGGDDHVYYCLIYFNDKTECLSWFSGQKIRQWPVTVGTASSTKPASDEILHQETIRIFSLIQYRGFGSMEYKKHAVNGLYYVIEPTAGRLDQIEYAATANGINFPLIAYSSLTGIKFQEPARPAKPVIYLDELTEINSLAVCLRKGWTSPSKGLLSLKGKKAYRYLNSKDPIVFLLLIFKILDQIAKKLSKH
jgi:D-aspartate ligase